jgi:hypothetical protein
LGVCSAVPRYFFNFYNHESVCDEEGQDLAGLDAAQHVAKVNAREMAAAAVISGQLNLKHRIDVVDENGKIVCTVRFEDIVKVQG